MESLAAVVAIFNPSNCPHRQRVTEMFLREWPAVTLQTSMNRHAAPIWQKERLLNLAIRSLPASVDKVIWIDGDLIVRSPTWAADVSAALDRWPVIQPWSVADFLGPTAEPALGPMGHDTIHPVPWINAQRETASGLPADAWPGFAWAARRETLEAIGGLYEHDLSGPNDVLMSLAFYGDFGSTFLMRYNGAAREHFEDWGRRAYEVVRGQVGFVEAKLTHLWHGDYRARKYLERTVRLNAAGFNPARHVGTAPDGSLCLTPDCPDEVRRMAARVVGVDLGDAANPQRPIPDGCCQ